MASLNTPLMAPPQKPKILDQLRAVIRLRHYSIRTEEAYTQWVKRFIFFHGKRHPEEMGRAEVEAFLTYLAVERKVAAATQNQAINVLVFFYREIIKREIGTLEDVVRPSGDGVAASGQNGRSRRRSSQTGELPYLSSLLRHSPFRKRL